MPSLRVALFVEGGDFPNPSRGTNPRVRIWNEHLCEALQLQQFSHIVPISKKHLVAMDPNQPKMSGSGEPLDELLARKLKTTRFDAAVVAWDLVPAWNPQGEFCRWDETLNLYRFLAESRSTELPEVWKHRAGERLNELRTRSSPSSRSTPPRLVNGMVLALCMEPMFETILVQNERAVKRALGITRTPNGWPQRGWGDRSERWPDRYLLTPAIASVRAVRPKLSCVRQVGGNYRNNKDEWGEFLLRQMLMSPATSQEILSSKIARRLSELLPRQPDSQ